MRCISMRSARRDYALRRNESVRAIAPSPILGSFQTISLILEAQANMVNAAFCKVQGSLED